MDLKDRVLDFVRALPLAHKVGIVASVVALGMLATVFASWVTTPTYTVLYSGLDEAAVAGAIDELETLAVPYRLEGGGTTILVPQEQLYETRASMAGVGFASEAVPQGYELLAEQGLSVSDFRQRVDYQRALEGEIAKTLMAMEGIDAAQVRLVLPEDELFADDESPVTGSVLLTTARDLDAGEVETVGFLVASSVEGLELDAITIADADGTVLQAPGEQGGASVATNRNLRQTREFEQAMAADVAQLLGTTAGSAAPSVVVRATLNFDEQTTQTETYDPDGQVTLREQTGGETFEGSGTLPGGAVGVDGGPVPAAGEESTYARDDATREFGVNRTTTSTVSAPGAVERLSVAIVMDDGTTTGAAVPPPAEVETLVTSALGLDAARGDTVAVTAVPFEEPVEEPEVVEDPMVDQLPRIVGIVVLLFVCLVFFLMTRRRKPSRSDREVTVAAAPVVLDLEPGDVPAPEEQETRELQPVGASVALPPGNSALKTEVSDLVQRQPEEIATLLRSWLADRRS